MNYIILDLEATCWEKGTAPSRMEIIEIGAVALTSIEFTEVTTFSRFVRPSVEPVLSDFCTQLTGIQQSDIDSADQFDVVLKAFLDWIGPPPIVLCSWGKYDFDQLHIDCLRHQIEFPEILNNHINLKKEFSAIKGIGPTGMKSALKFLGIVQEGIHHRALDDAKNIAKIAKIILPTIEASAAS